MCDYLWPDAPSTSSQPVISALPGGLNHESPSLPWGPAEEASCSDFGGRTLKKWSLEVAWSGVPGEASLPCSWAPPLLQVIQAAALRWLNSLKPHLASPAGRGQVTVTVHHLARCPCHPDVWLRDHVPAPRLSLLARKSQDSRWPLASQAILRSQANDRPQGWGWGMRTKRASQSQAEALGVCVGGQPEPNWAYAIPHPLACFPA